MELSIVIPAFQEAQRLPASLERIIDYVEREGRKAEIIVVDDGSTDGTASVAASLPGEISTIVLPENRGKGCAVRKGVLASKGARVLITDADLSSPIDELSRLEAAFDPLGASGAPIVFGSRAVDQSLIRERQPWYRQTMGKIFNLILRTLGVRGVRDTQCGFKLLDGPIAHELFAEMVIDGFAFDVELLLRAQRRNYTVKEVAVVWHHVEQSRVHPVIHSAHMLWDVLRLRLLLRI